MPLAFALLALPGGVLAGESPEAPGPEAKSGRWRGQVAAEAVYFPETALDPAQHGSDLSLALEAEYYRSFRGGKASLTFAPFVRLDQHDAERRHVDIREAFMAQVGERHEMRIGVRKVFWGVTEAAHLVDIVNQTDLVENPDGEDKLGQPMLNVAVIGDWGTLDIYALTGFRERRFPGREGRPRGPLLVDGDHPVYASRRGRSRTDWALRYAKSARGFDVGISHFSGNGREPRLVLLPGAIMLTPHYDLIQQTGLDATGTTGAWLWKFEVITRRQFNKRLTAFDAGFEYTWTGVFGSAADVGVLGEYLHDNRGATLPPTLFDDDFFAGVRYAFNDAESSEVLAGMILDRREHSRVFRVEASRRVGSHWKVSAEIQALSGLMPQDPLLYALRRDDSLRVEVARYF